MMADPTEKRFYILPGKAPIQTKHPQTISVTMAQKFKNCQPRGDHTTADQTKQEHQLNQQQQIICCTLKRTKLNQNLNNWKT